MTNESIYTCDCLKSRPVSRLCDRCCSRLIAAVAAAGAGKVLCNSCDRPVAPRTKLCGTCKPVLSPDPLIRWFDNGANRGQDIEELLGISANTLSRWRGGDRISLWTADRAACRLGAHPAALWGEEWWRVSMGDDYVPPLGWPKKDRT